MINFGLDQNLLHLSDEATALARSYTKANTYREDSWLVGQDTRFAKELARRGWLGMTWPTAVGGGGRPAIERLVIYEALISGNAPVASSWFADRQIGPTLLEYGTPQQQQHWIPAIIAGEALWCIGMSEPDAGSDVASLRTSAVRDGDEWIINGQKIWTSGAQSADWCYLIARTNPTGPSHQSLSEFVVDMRSAGVTVKPIKDMVNNQHFCEVYFDNVRVPSTNLVGTENGSFGQVMRQMEHERGGIDRLVSNRALFLDIIKRIDRQNPLVRQEIAAIETRFRIGRLMVYREVLQQAPKGFSAATKTFCTELEQKVASFCATVLGMESTLWEGPETQALAARVSHNICYAPGYTIMGGTTQILRNILGERVLGLPREPR